MGYIIAIVAVLLSTVIIIVGIKANAKLAKEIELKGAVVATNFRKIEALRAAVHYIEIHETENYFPKEQM